VSVDEAVRVTAEEGSVAAGQDGQAVGDRFERAAGDGLGHPWPAAYGRERVGAAIEAARFCLERGYPVYHAAREIADWNAGNRPPLDGPGLLRLVVQAYVGSELAERRNGGLLALSTTGEVGEREWLIPGFLPSGQRVGLLGYWGYGKSFLSLDAAFAVAYGTRFLGVHWASERGNVVMLDGEGGRRRAARRFHQLRRARDASGGSKGEFEIYWRPAHGLELGAREHSGSSARSMDGLRAELAKVSPRLVIFDTLGKVLGLPDENSNAGAARVTTALNRFSEDLGACLLLLSHPSKGDGRGVSVRGAGELSADLDVMWSIATCVGKVRQASCQKDRDGDIERRTFRFEIVARDGAVSPEPADAERVPASVVRALENGRGTMAPSELIKAVVKETGASRGTVYRKLQGMRTAGAVVSKDGQWELVNG
jgi:AAA domain